MRAIVVGTGTLGSAIREMLLANGHEVETVDRSGGGDHQADMSDAARLRTLFATLEAFDAVACAAGDVFPARLEQTTDEQWAQSIAGKGLGQINVVRAALPYIADRGSFTLVSGVLTEEFTHSCTIGTTINHLVEGFVRGAATEVTRGVRINCVSPTVLAESTAYHEFFPGFTPVPAAEVAFAYLRAMSNPFTGRILKLHRTDC